MRLRIYLSQNLTLDLQFFCSCSELRGALLRVAPSFRILYVWIGEIPRKQLAEIRIVLYINNVCGGNSSGLEEW